MPRTFTDWTADTVGGRLVQYASTPVDMSDYATAAAYEAYGYLPVDASDLPPFPECEGEGYAGPVAPSAEWVRTRTAILRRRDTVRSRTLDRAFAHTYGYNTAPDGKRVPIRGRIGSDTEQRRLDVAARGVPGFGSLHRDQ
jgi:hypothetical protein